jgi:hypothetical protein
VKYFDCLLQKEATNQTAVADLVVDGVVLAQKLPATLLLGWETRIKQIRELYEAIPTLQPGVAWEEDKNQRPGVFRAQNVEKAHKTEQRIQHKILVAADDHHPAQVEKWSEQVPVGIFTQERWSGMVSPAKKAELLEKIDTLLVAVKKARQRANQAEVVQGTVTQKLYEFIHN